MIIANENSGGSKDRIKVTPSAAAELKAQMEANQVGATPFEEESKIPAAIEVIRAEQKASVSLLQRRMKLGYGQASRIIDELERRGIIGPTNGSEPREILNLPEPGTPAPAPDNDITITSGDVKVSTSTKKLQKLAADVKKAKLKPKTQQGDMVTDGKLLVPEPDSPLYKAGKRLAEAVEQHELIKDEIAEANHEVMRAMRNAKKYLYKVKGYTFELHHKGAEDKVKVIKPK